MKSCKEHLGGVVTISVIIAFVLWFVMFSPWTSIYVNFWWMMTISALILTTLSCLWNMGWQKNLSFNPTNILLGIIIAATLWGIYWIGDKLSAMMFDFARPQVDLIYGMKEGESRLLLSLLLLFIIGPAEEIFWRGFIQNRLSAKYNANWGFVITTAIYAIVHVSALNFMLLMAALVAGSFWGLIYRFFPKYLTAIIISHALWDAAVFIWFPIL